MSSFSKRSAYEKELADVTVTFGKNLHVQKQRVMSKQERESRLELSLDEIIAQERWKGGHSSKFNQSSGSKKHRHTYDHYNRNRSLFKKNRNGRNNWNDSAPSYGQKMDKNMERMIKRVVQEELAELGIDGRHSYDPRRPVVYEEPVEYVRERRSPRPFIICEKVSHRDRAHDRHRPY